MRILVLATALALTLHGQKIPTGPAIGAAIPTFQAPDQNGRTQSLATVAGPKGTLLVFYRSADW